MVIAHLANVDNILQVFSRICDIKVSFELMQVPRHRCTNNVDLGPVPLAPRPIKIPDVDVFYIGDECAKVSTLAPGLPEKGKINWAGGRHLGLLVVTAGSYKLKSDAVR